jgi:hypothetical protein
MYKNFIKIKGGAGNQLFQYAFARAFSIKNGVDVSLSVSEYFDRPFENLEYPRDFFLDQINCKLPLDYSRRGNEFLGRIWRKLTSNYNVKFNNKKLLNKKSSNFLDGYWQSPLYFNGYLRDIYSDFDIREDLLTDEYFDLLKSIDDYSICVHVRLGDYLSPDIVKAYGPCSKQYYIDAINWFRSNLGASRVFLFSDDPTIAEEMLSQVENIIIISRPTLQLSNEFALMRKCSFFVISNSTLSWWAAYLETAINANKFCISPFPWFDDKNLYCDSLIPKNWLRMKK